MKQTGKNNWYPISKGVKYQFESKLFMEAEIRHFGRIRTDSVKALFPS